MESSKSTASDRDIGAPDHPRSTLDSGVVDGNASLSGPPFLVDGCDTLAKLFLHRCQTLGERTAHREKELGIWKSHSWAAFLDAARAIGLGLAALGLKRGEVVSVLSEDRKEWIYADLGVQCVGGIVSGIYTTDSAEQVAYLLADSRSRFLIVENEEQLEKFLAVRDRVPEVLRCIVLDREGLYGFSDDRVLFLDELYDVGRQAHEHDHDRFRREVEASRPDDVALLVYTSGTTGPPKGAMITHENVICSVASVLRSTPVLESQAEQVKDFRLIDVLLTPEDDELTPTMKIRRNVVERRHKALIDQMY